MLISQKTVFVVTAFRRNVREEIHKWEKTAINPKKGKWISAKTKNREK